MSCQCLKHVGVFVGVMSVFETWESLSVSCQCLKHVGVSVSVMSVFETCGSLCQCHVSV